MAMNKSFTEKLYYQDIHEVDFSASILNIHYDESSGTCGVILDRTAFFPESGGQKADKGTLDGFPVLDVRINGDVITHIMDGNIQNIWTPDRKVTGHVDWAQRFDFMQQHTGEHILSGLVHRTYGLNNVGFHLGYEDVTLDFDGVLSLEQLRELEHLANEAIWKNLPIITTLSSPEELQTLSYRSKLDLEEDVRIVEIPGYDRCACCAPHTDTTGQIGLLKVTSVQSHRGGIRINILCGGRALADYSEKQNRVSEISVLLSAKPEAVTGAVERLLSESLSRKGRVDSLQGELLQARIEALPAPVPMDSGDLATPSIHPPILLFEADLDTIAMRGGVNTLTKTYHGYCSIFSGNDEEGYRFITGSPSLDCISLSQSLKENLQAKSGGSPRMIQGSLTASREEIISFFHHFS